MLYVNHCQIKNLEESRGMSWERTYIRGGREKKNLKKKQ